MNLNPTARTLEHHEAETLAPILSQSVIDQAGALLKEADDAGLSLAVAESCTGGLLAALLTDIEGASHAFDRGFVVYSNEAKCELLGLSREMVDHCGAVSEEVARAMADAALQLSRADVALSITGFAGPGADDEEPGLVHFACARTGRAISHREEHFGDIGRGPTRIRCLETAIAMMSEALR